MVDETNIMVAVASHRSSIHPSCMTSIVDAAYMLALSNVRYQVATIDKSNVAIVFDVYTSLVVQDTTFSHVLFIDGDLHFGRNAILRLLRAGKQMIGLACPYRHTEPRFAVTFLNRKEAPVANGIVEVDSIGMAATLIHRSAFETMIQKAVVFSSKTTPATIPGLTGPLYNFFHPICTRERRLTEEASFCVRWRQQCGGQIHALIDEEVSQFGNHEFKGRLSDHLTFRSPAVQRS
jgi:hypothetical protein